MAKNANRFHQLNGEPLEIYKMISGIYGLAQDFRCEFTDSQKRLVYDLYLDLTLMNLRWLTSQLAEATPKPDMEKEIVSLVRQLVNMGIVDIQEAQQKKVSSE